MLQSIAVCVRTLTRNASLIFWPLVFPLIMAVLLSLIFAGVEDSLALSTVRLGVVRDDALAAATGLEETLEAISSDDAVGADNGEGEADGEAARVADLSPFADAEAATAALETGDVDAVLQVDDAGTPRLTVDPRDASQVSVEVLRQVLASYLHMRTAIERVVRDDPAALVSGDAIAAFRSEAVRTARLSLTDVAPDPFARYYYALLAMAAGMGAMLCAAAMRNLSPAASAVAARRLVGATSRWRLLAGTIVGAWLCEFACLAVALAFMRFVIDVRFGGNVMLIVGALAVSSLMACAAGGFFGTFRRVGIGAISGITCLLSLFSGLYGPSSQALTDSLEQSVPALIHANPLWQIANSLYALLYYDTLDVYARGCLTLAAMAAAFFALTMLRMRRQSYEQL